MFMPGRWGQGWGQRVKAAPSLYLNQGGPLLNGGRYIRATSQATDEMDSLLKAQPLKSPDILRLSHQPFGAWMRARCFLPSLVFKF